MRAAGIHHDDIAEQVHQQHDYGAQVLGTLPGGATLLPSRLADVWVGSLMPSQQPSGEGGAAGPRRSRSLSNLSTLSNLSSSSDAAGAPGPSADTPVIEPEPEPGPEDEQGQAAASSSADAEVTSEVWLRYRGAQMSGWVALHAAPERGGRRQVRARRPAPPRPAPPSAPATGSPAGWRRRRRLLWKMGWPALLLTEEAGVVGAQLCPKAELDAAEASRAQAAAAAKQAAAAQKMLAQVLGHCKT
eukprot:COSAG01_NODE_601_length_14954_cov_175.954359_7_plen_245_part_00